MEDIRLHVVLEPAEVVSDLRRQVDLLTLELTQARARLKDVEFRYAQEVIINNRLLDFCRTAGVSVPRSLFSRHDGGVV